MPFIAIVISHSLLAISLSLWGFGHLQLQRRVFLYSGQTSYTIDIDGSAGNGNWPLVGDTLDDDVGPKAIQACSGRFLWSSVDLASYEAMVPRLSGAFAQPHTRSFDVT